MLFKLVCAFLIHPEVQLIITGLKIGFGRILFTEAYFFIPVVQQLQLLAGRAFKHAFNTECKLPVHGGIEPVPIIVPQFVVVQIVRKIG
ncbi:hypothetical protein D3C80_1437950 [compost metagenome]